jgi:hypothetical protein
MERKTSKAEKGTKQEGKKRQRKEQGNYSGRRRALANNISIDFSPAGSLLFFLSRLHLAWCSWH